MKNIAVRFLLLALLCGAYAFAAPKFIPTPSCPVACPVNTVCCQVTATKVYGCVPPSGCYKGGGNP
jgi:hypothetical protein